MRGLTSDWGRSGCHGGIGWRLVPSPMADKAQRRKASRRAITGIPIDMWQIEIIHDVAGNDGECGTAMRSALLLKATKLLVPIIAGFRSPTLRPCFYCEAGPGSVPGQSRKLYSIAALAEECPAMVAPRLQASHAMHRHRPRRPSSASGSAGQSACSRQHSAASLCPSACYRHAGHAGVSCHATPASRHATPLTGPERAPGTRK